MDKTASQLFQRLRSIVGQGLAKPLTDDEFNRLALDVFAYQFERNEPYRNYCRMPPSPSHWSDIPAVPTSAFKYAALACFPVAEASRVFHTSGTTTDEPGQHYFRDTTLYAAAGTLCFQEHLAPDGRMLPAHVLTPWPEEAPHSSLVHMIDFVTARTKRHFYVRDSILDAGALAAALKNAAGPVMLLGTAFSFVHFLDHCRQTRRIFSLPEGSRVMETGGFKGRSREVSRDELHRCIGETLGVPGTHIINEYGMTELSSQFYDQSLRTGTKTAVKVAPPWTRVRVMDPRSGEVAKPGEPGLLRIWDLANVDSVACLQTEDMGIMTTDGFLIVGRRAGAEVRGCSLSAEAWQKR
jgi:hypothetical protein